MVSRGAAPPPAPPAPASRRLGFGLTRGLARQGGGQQVSPRLGGGGRPERDLFTSPATTDEDVLGEWLLKLTFTDPRQFYLFYLFIPLL